MNPRKKRTQPLIPRNPAPERPAVPRPALFAGSTALLILVPMLVLFTGEQLRALLDFVGGVLTLLSLTAAVVWGLIATDRVLLAPRQRLLAQAVHRAVAVASLGFLVMHIVLKVSAGHTSLIGALVPFGLGVRGSAGLIGLGSLAGYLMVIAGSTGALRSAFASESRKVAGRWRAIHSLAYPAWCAALVHGLYAGREAAGYVVALYTLCLLAVGLAVSVRILPAPYRRRIAQVLLALLRPGEQPARLPGEPAPAPRDTAVTPLPGAGERRGAAIPRPARETSGPPLESTRAVPLGSPGRSPGAGGAGAGLSAGYRAMTSADGPPDADLDRPTRIEPSAGRGFPPAAQDRPVPLSVRDPLSGPLAQPLIQPSAGLSAAAGEGPRTEPLPRPFADPPGGSPLGPMAGSSLDARAGSPLDARAGSAFGSAGGPASGAGWPAGAGPPDGAPLGAEVRGGSWTGSWDDGGTSGGTTAGGDVGDGAVRGGFPTGPPAGSTASSAAGSPVGSPAGSPSGPAAGSTAGFTTGFPAGGGPPRDPLLDAAPAEPFTRPSDLRSGFRADPSPERPAAPWPVPSPPPPTPADRPGPAAGADRDGGSAPSGTPGDAAPGPFYPPPPGEPWHEPAGDRP